MSVFVTHVSCLNLTDHETFHLSGKSLLIGIEKRRLRGPSSFLDFLKNHKNWHVKKRKVFMES